MTFPFSAILPDLAQTLYYPSVVWAILSFSIVVSVSYFITVIQQPVLTFRTSFLVMITLIPLYFRVPPYNFQISSQGLVYIAPCIGAVSGAFLCGWPNDKISQWSARRNGGVFEPEMRLPVMVFPTLFVPMGVLLFAYGMHNRSHWIIPAIGTGFVGV